MSCKKLGKSTEGPETGPDTNSTIRTVSEDGSKGNLEANTPTEVKTPTRMQEVTY